MGDKAISKDSPDRVAFNSARRRRGEDVGENRIGDLSLSGGGGEERADGLADRGATINRRSMLDRSIAARSRTARADHLYQFLRFIPLLPLPALLAARKIVGLQRKHRGCSFGPSVTDRPISSSSTVATPETEI